MSLNLDEKTMKELEDKNRPQQPVIVEEKVVDLTETNNAMGDIYQAIFALARRGDN